MTTQTPTTLTDAAIDALSGVELGIKVAEALGWKRVRPGVHEPSRLFADDQDGDRSSIPSYHTDTGAALGLLMGVDGAAVQHGYYCANGEVQVFSKKAHESKTHIIATGPIAECASVFSRAYLKLVSRKGRV